MPVAAKVGFGNRRENAKKTPTERLNSKNQRFVFNTSELILYLFFLFAA
jgi:hypothetical protein